jgi:uncharacterized membrane protein YoaT (DUF817 family)
MAGYTAVEQRIDRSAHALVDRAELRGARAGLVEFAVFVAKQAWACVFGFLLLTAIVAARLWYPDDALLARNDALTLAAIAMQVLMLATRLETLGELRVVLLFHVAGTVMELFKTAAGSWQYDPEGLLRIGAVPLFSGFMYAAVGSYMVRVHRLFDLRFDRYPRRWITALIAAGVYVNFFAHHVLPDIRWALIAFVLIAWWPTMMRARVLRTSIELPILVPFAGVAVVIWVAENVSTWAGAWSYPDQVDGWEPVSIAKVGSWFLLMIVSVVLVTWVYPPKPSVEPVDAVPDAVPSDAVELDDVVPDDVAERIDVVPDDVAERQRATRVERVKTVT